MVFFNLLSILVFGQFNQHSRDIEKQKPLETMKVKPPEFRGGVAAFYKYLSRKMKFPKDARQQKIKGNVMVEFIIDSLGNVKKESVKVVQSLIESCDNEAIRLIKFSPTWIPAVDLATNKKIASIYTAPIRFRSKDD